MGYRNVFWYSDSEFPKMAFRGTGSIKKVSNGKGGQVLQGWKTVELGGKLLEDRNSQHSFSQQCCCFFLPFLQHFILFRIGDGGCSARGVLELCARKGFFFRFASRANEGVVEKIELSPVHKREKEKLSSRRISVKMAVERVPFWFLCLLF
ncbi:hypothetical protein CDAR_620251 [Caerostris darwini]|uniref:Uncharacterized protein n=1 Tax=Caerostris darwini TaxID=1538125 RepID=A0AAV4VMH8_9ARAC|nr:hypothetical protein CDAR_620251 [Caerostris darwini]